MKLKVERKHQNNNNQARSTSKLNSSFAFSTSRSRGTESQFSMMPRTTKNSFNKTMAKSFVEDGDFEVDLNTTTQTYAGGPSFTSTLRDD